MASRPQRLEWKVEVCYLNENAISIKKCKGFLGDVVWGFPETIVVGF
jgi:hypothetical protein